MWVFVVHKHLFIFPCDLISNFRLCTLIYVINAELILIALHQDQMGETLQSDLGLMMFAIFVKKEKKEHAVTAWK